jgi:hypothetical protein
MGLHERGKRLVVLPADHAILGDQHPLEQGLVHQSAAVGVGVQICLVAVLSFLHGVGDRGPHLIQ